MENKKKILIIEDEEAMLLGIVTLLKSKGYEVIGAYDAMSGVSRAHKEKPDLVITDLGLPAGSGYSIIDALRKSIDTNIIPVLVLTANPQTEAEKRAYELGAKAYMRKPFDPEELLAKVQELLEN